ncbi:MAG: VCBS repeat-containing protein, partial [Candidatus Sumerlaeia bacterium]|nr:VCBS repeat-containing protein [Candidatus Sumerlaeia bacterium]
DGTFAAAVDYDAGDGPSSVTTGDFNGNGITDLAVANFNSANVSILLGNGNGTFAAAVNYDAGDGPSSLTTGDFNGNGLTDLVIVSSEDELVLVLLGNGDGTFAAPVTYVAGAAPFSVTTGDFNGDGITDLAVANSSSSDVSVLLGNGDGTFAAPVNHATGFAPFDVTSGDFNGDGFTDLATANSISNDVSVLLNLGFTEPNPVLTPTALEFGNVELGSAPVALSIVIDVTGDEDLISTPTLTNDGGGAFSLTSLLVSPLAQGTSGTLEVTFAPTSLGVTTGTLTLATNDLSSPTITIPLSANVVDTIAPTSTVTGPSGVISQGVPTFDVVYTASDNTGGSGIAGVELYYQLNDGGYLQYPGGPFTSSPISFDTSTTGGDGTYDFYTIATDNAGNEETKSPTAETTVTFTSETSVGDWQMLID